MSEASSEPVYQLTENGVQRLSDKAFIPECEDNRDWQAYQVWLAEGNTPEPLPVPPPDLTVALANGSARVQRTQKKEEQQNLVRLQTLEAELTNLKVNFYAQLTGD